jgi:hypothetical protein
MFFAAFTSALQAKPQATHRNAAWLSRDSLAVCPHALQRCEVNAGGTFCTRPGALSCSRRTSSPQPALPMPRFRPAFCATFRPAHPCHGQDKAHLASVLNATALNLIRADAWLNGTPLGTTRVSHLARLNLAA